MICLQFENITVRTARREDVPQLVAWWNDGRVMAHAGFPNGLGTSVGRETARLRDGLMLIEENGTPIGECNFKDVGGSLAEIGIKICEESRQNRGTGRIVLSMLIGYLFGAGFRKIILDTNLNNLRAQHVYETLGFTKLRVNVDSWTDQLGRPQSSVDYELTEDRFVDFRRK